MNADTSWEAAGHWYDAAVGEKGHFYHQHLIFPNVLRILDLHEKDRLLDIGCGQGVFARHIPRGVEYVGVDIASSLLQAANKYQKPEGCQFLKMDVTKPWAKLQKNFTHAACILVLQNIREPKAVFAELAKTLLPNGRAVFVLNHPAFRIPRQSRWGFDEKTKTQTRELFSYMSPQEIPIVTHPGKSEEITWSFHFPISFYTKLSHKFGFVIETIEEWCSPKKSQGGAARREDRARKEFPLFLALTVRKDG
jgi:ubiquinone/menaquinone biosynthesis C-methylase UbiE